jgi:hypothetical protein
MQAARFGTEETPMTSVAQLEELLGGPFPDQVRHVIETERRERPEWRIDPRWAKGPADRSRAAMLAVVVRYEFRDPLTPRLTARGAKPLSASLPIGL